MLEIKTEEFLNTYSLKNIKLHIFINNISKEKKNFTSQNKKLYSENGIVLCFL